MGTFETHHSDGPTPQTSVLASISDEMVRLYKEQFGRGPTKARSYWAGGDTLVVLLEDTLAPAELKLVAMGQQDRVRDSRTAFQAATAEDFVPTVERITQRRVRSFASGVDPDSNVVFECFYFAPRDVSLGDGDGNPPS